MVQSLNPEELFLKTHIQTAKWPDVSFDKSVKPVHVLMRKNTNFQVRAFVMQPN